MFPTLQPIKAKSAFTFAAGRKGKRVPGTRIGCLPLALQNLFQKRIKFFITVRVYTNL